MTMKRLPLIFRGNARWACALILGCWMAVGHGVAWAGQSCFASSVEKTMPTNNFLDNGDGTVTDKTTGLMWKRCSEGQAWDASASACGGAAGVFTWQGALQRAQHLNQDLGGYAGHTDWRVPNTKEISTIVERACQDPAINLTLFPNTPDAIFWSSSPYLGDYGGSSTDTMAWVEAYPVGNAFVKAKSDTHYLRLVRGGQ